MADRFPKLLVATEFPPNASGGGPAVARQMLKDWPVEKLFWWSCLPDRDRHFGREVAAHRVAFIPHKLYPHRRWCRQKNWLLEKIWMPWATRHLRKTLRIVRPEAVWVIPHGRSISPLARALPRAGVGFHVSIHDYPDDLETALALGMSRSRKLAVLTDKLYAAAATRDAISRCMVADLLARTGCDGAVAHAGLEQSDFKYLADKPDDNATDTIRIAYAGTVSRESTFVLFVQALAAIRSRLARPVSIEFFCSHPYGDRAWFDASWMHERGNLPEPQLAGALRACQWGFTPMSLAEDDRNQRFALPTKFVSYLAAGLPAITLTHPQSSLAKLARAYHVGPCITSGDPEVVSRELFGALPERNLWSKYGPEILRCARNEFDMPRMRATFFNCLHECAAADRPTTSSHPIKE